MLTVKMKLQFYYCYTSARSGAESQGYVHCCKEEATQEDVVGSSAKETHDQCVQ
jgi:hypothetical protein